MKKIIAGSALVLTALMPFSNAFAKVDWQVKANDKIASAEAMEVSVIDDAALWGIAIDPQTIIDFEDLVVQAHAAYDGGDYKLANSLAGQAKDLLDPIDEQIELAEEAAEADAAVTI